MTLIEHGYEVIGRDKVVDLDGNEMSLAEAMAKINEIARFSMVLDPNVQEDIVLSPGESGTI